MKLLGALIGGCVSLFVAGLLVLRLFPTELCYVSIDLGQCQQGSDIKSFKVERMLREVQDGLRTIQNANALKEEPHMLFIDDLVLDIQFVAKETSSGNFELVVVPLGGTAGIESSEVQTMHLTFSTVLDEPTQAFIKEACQKGSPFRKDPRIKTFCAAEPGLDLAQVSPIGGASPAKQSAAEPVTVVAEGLGIDVTSFEADYSLPKSVSDALEKACPDGACGEVAKFSVDPASKQVQELIVRPAPGHAFAPTDGISLVGDSLRLEALEKGSAIE